MSTGLNNTSGNIPNPVITLAAAVTPVNLTPDQSGSIILMPIFSAASVINLPAVGIAAGVYYKFILTGIATKDVVITPTTSVMQGNLCIDIAAGAVGVIKAGAASYTHKATGLAGDWSEVYCDGTNWYCRGSSGVAGGFT